MPSDAKQMPESAHAGLLTSLVRINMGIMAVALGVLGGIAVASGTTLILLRGGEHLGIHFALLSVFFPGYAVSWQGVFIGFLWGFVFGSISGAVVYWTYGRTISRRLAELQLVTPRRTAFEPSTFLFSGNAVGIALGTIGGLYLFAATTWLVLRGTAQFSEHAALLVNFLPGYDVSVQGAIIGGLQVFGFVYVTSRVFSGVYNIIAKRRSA